MEATLLAWEKGGEAYNVFNVGNEDWITVDEIVGIVLEAMELTGVSIVHKPLAHGVGWPGDVKRIALKIDKLRALGFKPSKNSRESILETARALLEEIKGGAK